MPDFSEVSLVIAFASFNKYTAQIDHLDDLAVAQVMAAYYELATAVVRDGGGRVLKFIGDAALVVFPQAGADAGVQALLNLKRAADEFMIARGWECRLIVKVHAGTVAGAQFGEGADARYDVIGKAVNVAARLESNGVALSAEAFRTLSPAGRKLFKKHTPPITYIRQEDAHQPRWAKR